MRPPATIPPATLYRLWEQGVPLSAAAQALETASGWRDARRDLTQDISVLGRTPRRPADDRATIAQHLQALAQAWEEQNRQRGTLRDALVQRLATGALMAIGFVHDNSTADRLSVVPIDAWVQAGAQPSGIEWERSRLVTQIWVFGDVRVVAIPTSMAPQIDDNAR